LKTSDVLINSFDSRVSSPSSRLTLVFIVDWATKAKLHRNGAGTAAQSDEVAGQAAAYVE